MSLVLLLDEGHKEAYRSTTSYKKLVRRLKAHYDVQVCVAASNRPLHGRAARWPLPPPLTLPPPTAATRRSSQPPA